MNEEPPRYSAEVFDPVAFAEWWYEHIWPVMHPQEYGCYMAAIKRWEGTNDQEG